ncbi:MAG: CIS tube protein, partial [Gammaproteobacteria bacterium]
MLFDDSFKLEKLKIEAYLDSGRTKRAGDDFEAMFNPETFKQSFAITYQKGVGLNDRKEVVNYSRSEPSDLNLRLIFDGTGVNEYGLALFGKTLTVQERINTFLALCYYPHSESHEPAYLKVIWGDLNFQCRLGSVEINYTRFDRQGKALRAELDILLL